MTRPPVADRFHALVRGDTTGPLARLARTGLWAARLPVGAGVWARNTAFDRGWRAVTKVPVPVVSVGNLSLGGTGKTPCVEAVAGFLRDEGAAVAILSRGYGAAAGRNDEAMVLEENLPDVPHLQGRDRVELARTAIEELESDVLVLDDGFQHRRLARDLDIVLVDSTRPVWRDHLFPRGTLREPVRNLRRADVVIVTRCNDTPTDPGRETADRLRTRFPNQLVLRAGHVPTGLAGEHKAADLASVHNRPAAAFCGIGNPDAFATTVESVVGETIRKGAGRFRTFPDHHNYTRDDVETLRAWAAELPADGVVLTTQKDLVKIRLPDLAGRPLWAVRVGFRVLDHEAAFYDRLRAVAANSCVG